MTNENLTTMSCAEAEGEILALLYGELPSNRQSAVEAHLASCARCRAVCDGHRKTIQLLDAWPAIDAPADAHTLAALAEARAESSARSRWRRMRPVVVGLAASVALFLLLTAFGTTAEYRDGRLTLSVGADPVPAAPVERVDKTAAIKQWVREAVREEVAQGMEAVITAVREDLAAWDQRQEQRRRLLARAADLGRETDRRQYAEALHFFARDMALTTNRMAEEMDAVIQVVSNRDVPGAAGSWPQGEPQ